MREVVSAMAQMETTIRTEDIIGEPVIVRRLIRRATIESLTSNGSVAAAVMVAAALAAIVVANTDAYYPIHDLLETPIWCGIGSIGVSITIEGFINDFLMAIFFLLVGVELKYELTVGVLTEPRQAAAPMLAACGGVACPALIFFLVNTMGGGHPEGWAIPVATDIAFALGIMSLMGDKVAPAAKVFFSTLAIADDVIGILIIALFYGQTPSLPWIVLSLAMVIVLAAIKRAKVYRTRWYLLAGLLLWACMFRSGIHATLAGVILAFFLPEGSELKLSEVMAWLHDQGSEMSRVYRDEEHVLGQHDFTSAASRVERVMHQVTPPLQRVESAISTPVNFLVLPLFAFANAQLRIIGIDSSSLVCDPVAHGVFFGLVLGKPIGIVLVTWILSKTGFAALPEGADWAQMCCVGIFGGIGFTMCILIAGLSFGDGPERLAAKCAILLASMTASILGILFITAMQYLQGKVRESERT